MADVHLYESLGEGTIDIVNGDAVRSMDGGLETAVFLSLFGGNQDDSGLQGDDLKQWWANFSEPDPSRKYRSETQFLLRGLPAVPANLRRVEDAAARDLAWMLETKLADAVVAQATIPAINSIQLTVSVEVDDQEFRFVFQTPPSA